MKRILKISAIILAVVMMCLSFSGCAQLDDMKATQAYWTQSGNASSLIYNDVEYVLIEKTKGHSPAYNTADKLVFVTDPDVPVLLSRDQGTALDISADSNFVMGVIFGEYAKSIDKEYTEPNNDNQDFFYDPNIGKDVIYCKKDIYDDVVASIESGVEYTGYGYAILDYENVENPYIYINDEQAKLIEKVIDDANLVDDNDYSIRNNCFGLGTLDHISKDKYFGKAMYEVYWSDMGVGEYYLSCIEPDYDGKESVYAVPLKYSEDFDDIFQAIHKAMGN